MIYPDVKAIRFVKTSSTEAIGMWLSKYICCHPDFLCIRIGTYFEFLVFLSLLPTTIFNPPLLYTAVWYLQILWACSKNASTGQNSVTQVVEAHD